MISRITSLIAGMIACCFSVNAVASFGRTPGQFVISPFGSAQYSIPIWTPPGIRGIQPDLALTYDSRLSYGLMGPGWTLGGLSIISRCNRTIAQDGTPAGVTLTYADAFCLDGNRLRLTSSEALSTYGQGGTTYQTEIANFSNVTASSTLAGNGPSYFTVRGKDGLTYEYGNTTDSKILPAVGATPYIWALDKVTDRSGNTMTFTYFQSGGAYVPLSIQYTAPAGSTSFPYQVQFKYSTKSAADTISKSIGNYAIQQTNQLSTITMTGPSPSAGTTVRKYILGYTTSSATLRATLTSIQECGGAAGTDCLTTATSVSYQYGIAGSAPPATATGSGPTAAPTGQYAHGTGTADFNGDGMMDIFFTTTAGYVYVQLGSATGYGPPISAGSICSNCSGTGPPLAVGDFFGSGQAEFLYNWNGNLYLSQWNAASASFSITHLPSYSFLNETCVVADVDGNALDDLVCLNSVGAAQPTLYVWQNTATGSTLSFNLLSSATLSGGSPPWNIFGKYSFPNSSVRRLDFNGDGRDDIIITSITSLPPTTYYNATQMVSTGTGYAQANKISSPNSAITLMPVNWNDDNCTDLYAAHYIWVSGCGNGFFLSQQIGGGLIPDPWMAMDWDGDGRTDLIVPVGATFNVWKSTGTNFTPNIATNISVSGSPQLWFLTDLNGDGLDDLVYANSAAGNALYYGLHHGADTHADLAISFTDGYGLAAKPSYAPITQGPAVYIEGNDQVFPQRNYIGPLYVVNKAIFTDPSNASSGTYYQNVFYGGGVLNLQGRGFEGFEGVTTFDSRNSVQTEDLYNPVFPYTGIKNYQAVSDAVVNGIELYEFMTWQAVTELDSTVNNQRFFPYFSVVFNYITEGTYQFSNESATDYTYDNYGNATNVSTEVMDNDRTSPYAFEDWTSTVVNTIAPNTSTWCLGLPTATTVTNSSTAATGFTITRTADFVPDYGNCRQTQQIVESSSTVYKVTTAYGYDGFGNLNNQTVTGVGMSARTTGLNWGTSGQFPTTVTNPLSQVTTLGFDPNSGMLTSVKDPNLITTSWTYDNFARKNYEHRPDGTSTTWAYNSCATSGCVNTNNKMTVTKTVVNMGGGTQSTQNVYLDELDRVLVASSTMLNGAFDRKEVQYDSVGNVHLQAAPCAFAGCATYWTINTYDVLNELIESQRPISATNATLQTTLYTYAGRTSTVQDALGHTSTKISHVNGLLGRSQDPIGYYQEFAYDAFGSLLSVKDKPGTTLFTAAYKYGLSAFQQSSTDMDLGARSFTIDALGELTAYSDAKTQDVSITYDGLSRPLVRTEPDLTTTWNWGGSASKFDIGKLNYVTATGSAGTFTDAYGYDSDGRLSTRTLTLPGDATYLYTYTYNTTTGLLDTLQYPVSTSSYQLKLQYAYANGLLKSVADFNAPTTVFWLANTADPRGQVTQETLGNGVITNRSYDAVTGWVNNIQSGIGGGFGRLNSSYLFDLVGNVTQRQDNNLGLTENFYYDTENRLNHSTFTVGTTTTTNLQMGYDTAGMGNIVSRSDVAGGAAWTYDPVRKHAVTQAGSGANSYSYDNNGNAITRNGYAIAWSSYNYPTGISSAGESVEFFYGPDRQRWKTIYSGSIGTETTYHVGKLLEKVANGGTIDYRHYIFAGKEQVAIYSRMSSGTNTLRYMLEDHQGSIASILTSTGPTDVNESFTAFGNRRSAETWSGPPTTGDETAINGVSRQGFTGQTALGVSMGLNHMNGRVEDAVTGRFLSPDPYVTDPGNTQNFNRYSYVNNNPLSFTDPSGFDLDPITVNASLGGPEDPVADVASAAVAIFDLGELFGWFGASGGGPTLTPMQQAGVAHGIDLQSPLQGAPSFQSVGGASFATEDGSGTVATQVTGASSSANQITVTATRASQASIYLPNAANAVNTAAIYSLLGQEMGIDPTEVRTGVQPYAAENESQIDGFQVTAWRAAPGSGDFNFAPVGVRLAKTPIERSVGRFVGASIVGGAALAYAAPYVANGLMATSVGTQQVAQRVLLRIALEQLSGWLGPPATDVVATPEVAEFLQQVTEAASKISDAAEFLE